LIELCQKYRRVNEINGDGDGGCGFLDSDRHVGLTFSSDTESEAPLYRCEAGIMITVCVCVFVCVCRQTKTWFWRLPEVWNPEVWNREV